MLTLTLLRHAKSSWEDNGLDDHERPLSKRGVKAARLVGKYLAAASPPVDRVLCSDAVRARATLTLALSKFTHPLPQVTYEPTLYLTPPGTYLDQLSSCASTCKHVLIVGHNPTVHMLALELVNDGMTQELAALAQKFPTAALAMIEFDTTSWQSATKEPGKLVRYITPKQLS